MARRIREHDWARTPLGPIGGWPQSLKTAAEMVLAMPGPATILWGPEHVQLYNDAYVAVARDRHPGLLGRPAAEGWPDAYEGVIAPLLEAVRLRRPTELADYPVALRAPDGRFEERVFDTAFSPVRDESGKVAGALQTLAEVTDRKRAEAALGESEARYRAFVTASSDAVYRMGPDWAEMRNLDGRGFISDTAEPTEYWMERYIHEDDRALVEATIGEAVRSKNVFELEHRVVRADGTLGWTLSRAVPIVGAGGEVLEWLGTASDVTARKEGEERRAFLLELSDAVRPLADPVAIEGGACRLLAERLGADRAYYVEVDEAAGVARVGRDFVRGGSPSLAGEHRAADYSWAVGILRRGEHYAIADTRTSPLVPPADRPAFAALGIIACVGAPLVKAGRLVGALCVTDPRQREWTEGEVDLLREVGERVWAAVERARAEEALARSEERFRTLFESIDEGFAIGEAFRAEDGSVDYRHEAVNPAWERIVGTRAEDAVGRTAREVLPDLKETWHEAVERAGFGGESIDVEGFAAPVGKWLAATFSPVGPGGGGRLAFLLRDVTERKRHEANLAFLNETSQDLARLSDIGETMDALGEKIAEHLGLSACAFAELDEAADIAFINHGWHRDDTPSLLGTYCMEEFMTTEVVQSCRAGDAVVIRDVFADPRTDGGQYAALNIGSFVSVPLVRGGVWRFLLVVYRSEPHDWRDDEIELLRELTTRIWTRLERARAEEALLASEEKYRTLVENVGDHAIFMLDAEGYVTEWTESARRVKGYAAEEVVGRHFSLFHAPEGVAAGEPGRELEEAAREGRAEREGWRVCRDGKRLWVDEIATAVRGAGGELVGFAKIARDLTERRELEGERERARSRELTALAEAVERERISRELHDRVAHHMGVAHQSLELHAALRGAAPERAEEKLRLARETARRALDQTRALSAELKRLQEEELEDGLEAALRALAATMSDGVGVDVSASGDESAVPKPFALQVYLAMREAVRNALRHSGCSRVGVTLEISDGEVRGSVEDDGRGFDPEAVGGATPSWGVGLRSMRERAEMLGGNARIDSEPGAGTRVEVRVPLDGRRDGAAGRS